MGYPKGFQKKDSTQTAIATMRKKITKTQRSILRPSLRCCSLIFLYMGNIFTIFQSSSQDLKYLVDKYLYFARINLNKYHLIFKYTL